MVNGIKIDTIEKFHQHCGTVEDKVDALFELELENSRHCQCRLEQCRKDFIQKMRIKNKYLPISRATFFFVFALIIYLLGAGIFRPEDFLRWLKMILPMI